MGLKRVVAIIEVTYPANDPRTLDELKAAAPEDIRAGLTGETPEAGTLAACSVFNAYVDPDAEPSLPETGFMATRRDPAA